MTTPEDRNQAGIKTTTIPSSPGKVGLFAKDPQKTTLENTIEYLKQLKVQCEEFMKAMNETPISSKFLFILTEIPKRLKLLEPYKDGYDAADDILGVTVIPTLGTAYAVATACVAIYEAGQALFIHFRDGDAGDKKVQELKNSALNTLVDAALIFTAVVAVKLISIINLVTRSAATFLGHLANSEKAAAEGGNVASSAGASKL